MVEERDTGDPSQVAKGKTKAQQRALDCKVQLTDILETYGGRDYLWRILDICGVFQAADSEGIERFEGRRDIGLSVLAEIMEVGESWFPKMMQEAKDRNIG